MRHQPAPWQTALLNSLLQMSPLRMQLLQVLERLKEPPPVGAADARLVGSTEDLDRCSGEDSKFLWRRKGAGAHSRSTTEHIFYCVIDFTRVQQSRGNTPHLHVARRWLAQWAVSHGGRPALNPMPPFVPSQLTRTWRAPWINDTFLD